MELQTVQQSDILIPDAQVVSAPVEDKIIRKINGIIDTSH